MTGLKRLGWLCAGILSFAGVTSVAAAAGTDAKPPTAVLVTRLPIGKTSGGRKIANLSYSIYELHKGKWQLQTKQSTALGDCAECSRGVALSCAPSVPKAECTRLLGGGLYVRVEGVSFDQLNLAIKNRTRMRVGRPEGNTSWPLELVMYQSIEPTEDEKIAAKIEHAENSRKPEEAESRRELYKVVLDVTPAKTRNVTHRVIRRMRKL